MEQRSLRVVSTNKNFFTKLTNTISRLLIPTKLGINGIMISIKRSSLVKAFEAYKNENALWRDCRHRCRRQMGASDSRPRYL